MKVKELKEMINDYFDDEKYDDCDVVVVVNGNNMEITSITSHGHYTKPGGLPFEINIS